MKNNRFNSKKIDYIDDEVQSIADLFRMRFPILMLGLILGIGVTMLTASFEELLSKNVHVAFFLPFIVYIADAVGNQTENIYSRNLKNRKKPHFWKYFHKELLLGIFFGASFGLISGLIVILWLKDLQMAISLAVSSFFVIATAPLIALLVTQSFKVLKKDPAVGAGPIATVLQDIASIVIYGIIASAFIL